MTWEKVSFPVLVYKSLLIKGKCRSAPASVQEYFTMMAAGLAGATPHMISATITAMSRLIFEFRGAFSTFLPVEPS